MQRAILILLLTFAGLGLAIFLGGCTTAPTPFETGAEAPPPQGCVEGRLRDVDC